MSDAVKDGELLYFSPSSVQLATECPRKWWYKYVGGIREPETKAQKRGKEIHARIANYLLTGDDLLERTERAAIAFMPAPKSPGMLVEWKISPDDREVVIAGVAMKGFVDLARDVDGAADITDWKTTRSEQWFKQPTTIQMTLYAKWAFILGYTLARLHHVYILTRGAPRAERLTAVRNEEQIDYRIDELGIERTVEGMKRFASIEDVEAVPGNRSECDNYGGCPHRATCTIGRKHTLAKLFGEEEEEEDMGIVADAAASPQRIETRLVAEEVWGRVLSLGRGAPAVTIHLAVELGLGSDRLGSGEFGEYQLDTLEELVEFANAFGVGVPTPAPPDAPPSEPEKHAPEPPATPPEEGDPGPVPTPESEIEAAFATLKAGKCGKKDRLAAVAVIERAFAPLPKPSETPLDELRTAVRQWLGLE